MVVSGLWTSMCFAYTALHGIREGYEVYGLMDAGGDSTPDAHRYGINGCSRPEWFRSPLNHWSPNGCTTGPTRRRVNW